MNNVQFSVLNRELHHVMRERKLYSCKCAYSSQKWNAWRELPRRESSTSTNCCAVVMSRPTWNQTTTPSNQQIQWKPRRTHSCHQKVTNLLPLVFAQYSHLHSNECLLILVVRHAKNHLKERLPQNCDVADIIGQTGKTLDYHQQVMTP